MLRKTGNWDANKQSVSNIDVKVINDFFANIATDPNYSRADVIQTDPQPPQRPYIFLKYGIDKIERMLARIRRTSPVNDNIPYWVYRDYASELAQAVCRMINMSIGLGVVPSAWRTAVITPVSKCTPVNSAGNLRPISVMPILSHMVERLIVKDHIFPSISIGQLFDQYGDKKTGRTTAAQLLWI